MSPRHIYPAEFFEDQGSSCAPVKRGKPSEMRVTACLVTHEKRVLASGCVLITLKRYRTILVRVFRTKR